MSFSMTAASWIACRLAGASTCEQVGSRWSVLLLDCFAFGHGVGPLGGGPSGSAASGRQVRAILGSRSPAGAASSSQGLRHGQVASPEVADRVSTGLP